MNMICSTANYFERLSFMSCINSFYVKDKCKDYQLISDQLNINGYYKDIYLIKFKYRSNYIIQDISKKLIHYVLSLQDNICLIAPSDIIDPNEISYFTHIGYYNDTNYYLEYIFVQDYVLCRLWKNFDFQEMTININNKNISQLITNELGNCYLQYSFLKDLFYKSEQLKDFILANRAKMIA